MYYYNSSSSYYYRMISALIQFVLCTFYKDLVGLC